MGITKDQLEAYKQATIQKSLDHLAQVRQFHKEAAAKRNTTCICKCCRIFKAE